MTTTDTTTTTVRDLKAMLARIKPAVPTRSSIAALTCVRLGDGEVHSTDMDAYLAADLPAAGFAPILAPLARLSKVLTALKAGDEVTLGREGDALVIESRLGRTTLPEGCPLEDWPASMLPAQDATPEAAYAPHDPAAALVEMLDASSFVATDEARPVLMATQIRADEGGVRLVATDSYRLARSHVAADVEAGEGAPMDALAPSLARYAAKLGSVERIELHGRVEAHAAGYGQDAVEVPEWVVFVGDGVRLAIRCTAGEFPELEKLVPDSFEREDALVDAAGMVDAARYVTKLAEGHEPVVLALDGGEVEMQLAAQGGGAGHSARFAVEPVGDPEPMRIGVAPDFLADSLAFVGEGAMLRTIGPLRPLVFEAGARLVLLMPTRLSD